MSKIALSPNASGTGVFTIASPSGNTDRTLTLPDEAGTVLTSAGVPASAMPAGSVLQVVQGYNNAKVRITTSGYVWQNAAVITPTSASSKILIIAQIMFGRCNVNGGLKLLRNDNPFMPNLVSSYLGGTTALTGAFNTVDDSLGVNDDYSITSYPVMYLDSPNTTSQLSYGVYFYTNSSGTFVNLNRQEVDNGGSASSTTVLEIAA